eukprot:2120333-Alexandrium_andersonii.AAC.1
MSASLVGSEMCIRDRSRARRRADAILRSRARVPRSSGWGRRRSRSVRPVSYTHLTLPTICSV